jgi:electron transfer flavoprotein alpha subunit
VRIAVLVKQVPRFEAMRLGEDGRMVREGIELELNPYCRRAVSKGVELARARGGTCTVVTLGPESAEDSLREAIAWGADEGVLVSDPAFAGSDTLATARALAATLERLGPFDLVLCGRNSVDADTGQVAPQVAQLLGLPFLGAVKRLELDGSVVQAHLELDDGWVDAEVELPAVVSAAERLCDPCKMPPEARAAVPAEKLRRLAAPDLGPGPWGQAGSPTRVGRVRVVEIDRAQVVLDGPVDEQVRRALAWIDAAERQVAPDLPTPTVPDGWVRGDHRLAVIVEPDRPARARELLGAAAGLAQQLEASVVALTAAHAPEPDDLGAWGADEVVAFSGLELEEDVAAAVSRWAGPVRPWAVLAPGTMWGREVASRTAAALRAGLTGDAVELEVAEDRLVAWKPAFGGHLVAAVTASSAVQMATVRPGILPVLAARPVGSATPVTTVPAELRSRVRRLGSGRDDELDALGRADVVVGVGAAITPDEYDQLEPLLLALGAELAATRKVTDNGWLPRARQVGITGRSIAPRLYVALAMSGKFNHMVGVRSAGTVLAVNQDPSAVVFKFSDVGIVGDWHEVVSQLADQASARNT